MGSDVWTVPQEQVNHFVTPWGEDLKNGWLNGATNRVGIEIVRILFSGSLEDLLFSGNDLRDLNKAAEGEVLKLIDKEVLVIAILEKDLVDQGYQVVRLDRGEGLYSYPN